MASHRARHSSHVAAMKEDSVCLASPPKSDSHATRYRKVPRDAVTMVLLAAGQILDGRAAPVVVDVGVRVLVFVEPAARGVGVGDVCADDDGRSDEAVGTRLVTWVRSARGVVSWYCLKPGSSDRILKFSLTGIGVMCVAQRYTQPNP